MKGTIHHMNILQGAFLGLIQGLTEFLPVSSSGHLNLLQALFGLNTSNQLLFDLLMHVGTLAAVAIFFWKDWVDMLLHPIRNKTLILLFVASLPALAAKILFDKPLDWAETHNDLLGICFLVTSLMLVLTQFMSRRAKSKQKVGFAEALVMGCLQAFGMLPGISRSGSTIFGGVLSGLDRKTAAKFSFMMSAPAIVAGTLSEGKDAIKAGISFGGNLPAMLVGVMIAFISGYLAIRFFMALISKASLSGFALYMAILGIVTLILQGMGLLASPNAEAVSSLLHTLPLA